MQNVKTIEIERVEGYTEDLITMTVKSFEAASKAAAMMAASAPDDGSYDKADFTITWTDGEQYKGRLDLTKEMEAGYNLLEHITRSVEGMVKMGYADADQAIDFIEKYIGYDYV